MYWSFHEDYHQVLENRKTNRATYIWQIVFFVHINLTIYSDKKIRRIFLRQYCFNNCLQNNLADNIRNVEFSVYLVIDYLRWIFFKKMQHIERILSVNIMCKNSILCEKNRSLFVNYFCHDRWKFILRDWIKISVFYPEGCSGNGAHMMESLLHFIENLHHVCGEIARLAYWRCLLRSSTGTKYHKENSCFNTSNIKDKSCFQSV
jgi:hypothetical protein